MLYSILISTQETYEALSQFLFMGEYYMKEYKHNEVECFDLLVKAEAYLTNRNLINQTMFDITSTADFNLEELLCRPNTIESNTSFEDTQKLLQKADKELRKYKNF